MSYLSVEIHWRILQPQPTDGGEGGGGGGICLLCNMDAGLACFIEDWQLPKKQVFSLDSYSDIQRRVKADTA